MSIITHEVNSIAIGQRPEDGYINLTRMVKAANKQINNYLRTNETKAFLEVLSAETRYGVSDLVQIVKGGSSKLEQGTWAHPQVAIHCAQWCSPEFAVLVTKWVFEWMTQGNTPTQPTDSPTPLQSDLNDLISQTNRLYGEFETILINPTPALEIAREIGDRLLQLKAQVGHGNWELFREENIRSPHTGQPMPSSTATLYQRIAKNWDLLQQVDARSVRDAIAALRRGRNSSIARIAVEQPQTSSSPSPLEFLREGIELAEQLGGFDEFQASLVKHQILEILIGGGF